MARTEGFAGIKIIHGYGSSGAGGAIRSAVQAELMQRVRGGEILWGTPARPLKEFLRQQAYLARLHSWIDLIKEMKRKS